MLIPSDKQVRQWEWGEADNWGDGDSALVMETDAWLGNLKSVIYVTIQWVPITESMPLSLTEDYYLPTLLKDWILCSPYLQAHCVVRLDHPYFLLKPTGSTVMYHHTSLILDAVFTCKIKYLHYNNAIKVLSAHDLKFDYVIWISRTCKESVDKDFFFYSLIKYQPYARCWVYYFAVHNMSIFNIWISGFPSHLTWYCGHGWLAYIILACHRVKRLCMDYLAT